MSSQHSPILSRGGEHRESREKRDGELDLMFSFAARDQDGLIPLSLSANGLAMDDLEDKLCRWMLLTKGRTVNPPKNGTKKDQPSTDATFICYFQSPSFGQSRLKNKSRRRRSCFTIIFTAFYWKLPRFCQRRQRRAPGRGSRGQAGRSAAR